jgi:hypothetical protein
VKSESTCVILPLYIHCCNEIFFCFCRVWSSSADSHGIHPAIVRLGLKYNNYTIIGSDARAAGLLSAFDQVNSIEFYFVSGCTKLLRAVMVIWGIYYTVKHVLPMP